MSLQTLHVNLPSTGGYGGGGGDVVVGDVGLCNYYRCKY